MDFVSALQYCDEILKLQVDHKETLELREQIQQQEMMNNYLDNGMLYYLNKETEKAITEFELVLIISPDHDEAKDYLLDLYKKQVNVSNDEDDYVTSLASWLRVRDLAPGDKEAKREIYRLERSLTEEERKAAITASKPPTEIPANRATIASSATPTPIAATTPITPPTPTPTTTTPTTTRPTTTTPTTTRPTTTRPTTTRPTTTRPTTTTPTTTTPTTIPTTPTTEDITNVETTPERIKLTTADKVLAKKLYISGLQLEKDMGDVEAAVEKWQMIIEIAPDPEFKYYQKAKQKLQKYE